MNRRDFLKSALLVLGSSGAPGLGANFAPARPSREEQGEPPPNFVILFADDLGYGDLGCLGHPTLATPNLDRMAAEGMKLTQFYSGAPVCTPSRAALLTGRLPIRSGMCSDRNRVLFPDSEGGLPDSEITLAQALKELGYSTACIGKWHLGHLPPYLPTRRGFDRYFGIPYSNDMKPCMLLEGEEVVEEPAVQETLTKRYTEAAVRFIREERKHPFFLYFPHTFPHVPLHASGRFKGESLRGLYGDVVEELDWSVGQVLKTLRDLGLEERTFVLFTSDNGPWLTCGLDGGSAGLLRGGKGSTWEGGMREPCIAWWPGRIRAGAASPGLASTLDLFPTLMALAGGEVPSDRTMDGVDLSPLLFGRGESPRKVFFYYRDERLMAVRKGPWKAHFITQAGYGEDPVKHDPPLLYHLEHDPSERQDQGENHPDILDDLLREAERHEAGVEPVPSQLDRRKARK